MKTAKIPLVHKDALDTFAASNPKEIIALLLWKARMTNPDMAVQITEKDIAGFRDCCTYLKVEHQVKIHRPQGRQATPAMPATATRSAIPAYPAEPPRPYVVVQLLDKAGDGIRPVENNEQDFDRAQRADKRRKAKDEASRLVSQVRADLNAGTMSTDTIMGACNALLLLAADD